MLVPKNRRWWPLLVVISLVLIGFTLLATRQGLAQESDHTTFHNLFFKDFVYDSTLYIQNLASSQANINFVFIAQYNSTTTTEITRTIPSFGGLELAAGDLDELDSDYYSLIISADQPIQSVVQSISSSDSSLLAYRGIPQGETHQYFGPFYKDGGPTDSISAINFWNVSAQQATVTVTARTDSGDQVDKSGETLNPGEAWDYVSLESDQLPEGFEGWVEAYTEHPLATLHNYRTPSRPTIFQRALEDQSPYAMPRVFKGVDEGAGDQSTKVFVGNAVSVTNEVTGTYYAMDGNVLETFTSTLPGNGFTWADPQDASMLPTTGTWAIIFTSTHPIAIGEQTDYIDDILSPSEGYESVVGSSIALPHLTNSPNEYTIFSVQNTANTTATTEITYRDLAGDIVFTESISLPPTGWMRYNLRQISQLSNFTGNAVIKADQTLKAWVDKYLVPLPDISIEKNVNDTGVPGSTMEYQLRVENQGDLAASDVILTDTLPISLTYVSWRGRYNDHILFDELITETVKDQEVIWPIGDIGAGEDDYIYLTVRVTDTLSGGDIITNTADITTSDMDSNSSNNYYETPTEVESPHRDVGVTKYLYGDAAPPGGTMKYRIPINNSGNVTATNVVLTDTLPTGLKYISWSSSPWYQNHELFDKVINEATAGQAIVWSIGDIGAEKSDYIYLTVRVTDTLSVGDKITNTVDITTSDTDSNSSNNHYETPTEVESPYRDVRVSKFLYDAAPPGGTIEYELSINNSGNVTATNVVLTDTLPTGLKYISWSSKSWYQNHELFGKVVNEDITDQSVVWNIGDIGAEQSAYIYLTVRVTDTLNIGEKLTNTAFITTSDVDSNPNNNDAKHTTTIAEPEYDVQVNKDLHWSSEALLSGNEIKYQISYYNDGNMPARNIRITDTLSSNVSYVEDSGDDVTTLQTGSTVIWERDVLSVGHNGQIYLTVRITDTAMPGDWLTNTVHIGIPYTETNYTDNEEVDTRTVEAPTRDVRVEKSLNDPVAPGGILEYTINFRNDGNSLAHDVLITDTLPVSLTYLSWEGELWNDDYFSDYGDELRDLVVPTFHGDGRIVWHLNELDAGTSGYIDLTARLTDTARVGGSLINTIAITCAEPDSDPNDNEFILQSSISDVTQDMDGEKELYWDSPPPVPGKYIEYRIRFENNGTATAHDVVITDTLPITAEYDSWEGYFYNPDYKSLTDLISPTLTSDQKSVVWDLPSLESNSSGYLYLRVRVPAGAKIDTELTNRVDVSTSDVDIDTTNNSDSAANIVVSPTVDMRVDKGLRYGTPGTPGGWMAYRIEFENDSNISVGNVIVSDTLPPGVSLASWEGYLYNPDYVYLPNLVSLVQEGQTLTWNLGELSYGAYGYIYLWVQVSDTYQVGDKLENVVELTSNGKEYTPGNNTYTLTTKLTDKKWNVDVYKDNSGKPATTGGTMRYYISYDVNASNWPATDVIITDTLPPSATFESWYGYGWHPDYVDLDEIITPTQMAGGKVTWNLGTLPPDSSGRLYVTIRLDEDTKVWDRVYNQVEASSAENAQDTSEEKDRVILPLQDLYISKYLYGEAGTPGGQMTYGVHFENNGNTLASNVVVTDTLPDGTNLASWRGYMFVPDHIDLDQTITPTQRGDSSIIWNIDNLPANAYGYIYLTVNISDTFSVGDQLTNMVEIGSDGDEDHPDDNRKNFVTTLTRAQTDLSINKSIHSPSKLRVPGAVDYSRPASSYPHLQDEILDDVEKKLSLQTKDADHSEHLAFQQLRTLEGETRIGGEVYILKPEESYEGVVPGQEIKYQLYFANTGNVSIPNVTISDTIPTQTDFDSWYGHIYTPDYQNLVGVVTPTISGNQVTWEIGSLGAGHHGYIYPTVHVTDTASIGTDIVNRADISGDVTEDDTNNNSDAVTTTVEGLVSLTGVTITGETTPTVGLAYTYNADISPDEASSPSYTWAPEPDTGQGTASATYSWDTTGLQSISVVVSNPGGTVSDSHEVIVVNVAPTDVAISGPSSGTINESYNFNASVTPPNAADLTYAWTPEPDTGQGTPSAAYHWPTTGLKNISVEARNDAGVATDDHDINIQPQAPDTVQVTGPHTGTVEQRIVFTATFEPGSVVLPLTYTWEATEQSVVSYLASDIVTTIPFTWSQAGPKTVTVTVGQTKTIDSDTWDLTIFDIPEFDVFLPLVLKNS